MAVRKKLRSYEWFGGPGIDSMVHRSWMKNQGLPRHLFEDRPVIGICNTGSKKGLRGTRMQVCPYRGSPSSFPAPRRLLKEMPTCCKQPT